MSSVETGQMSAVETEQMSAAETRQMLKSQGSGFPAALSLVQRQAKPKSCLTKVPGGAQNIKFVLKCVENRRFGLKLSPNESQGPSGPIRTSFAAKNLTKYTQNCRAPALGGRYLV